MPRMTKAEKAAEVAKREARVAEAQSIVATGKCPKCGNRLRRNLSMTGWWQCGQSGAEQFRDRPQDPPCSWQIFTV